MAARTPLKNVRRLGSAKEGTDDFWRQRVTSVAGLLLLPFALWIVLAVVGADYGAVARTLGNPVVAILLLLFIVTSVVHMRIGMQVIIEDYVHTPWLAATAQLTVIFVCVLAAIASVLAVIRIALGA